VLHSATIDIFGSATAIWRNSFAGDHLVPS
jgi:hypothetical protein